MANNEYTQPFFDTLSQGVQVAQSLRQAALQQQQLDQERQAQQARQGLAQQEFQASQQQGLAQQLANGAQPVDSSGNVQTQAPTVKASQPQTVTAADGMPMTEGGGGTSLDFTKTAPASVPADTGRTYSIAGKTLQAPSIQYQLDRATALDEAKRKAGRVPIGSTLEKAAGLPQGTMMEPEMIGRLGQVIKQLKPEDSGPSLKQSHIVTDDKGNQTLVSVMDDNTVKETPLKSKGKSDKFGNPEAAAAAISARAMTENQAREGAQQAHKDYLDRIKEEQALDTEANNIAIALKTGKHYIGKDGTLQSFSSRQNPIPQEEQGAFQDAMKARLQAIKERLPQVISDKKGAMNLFANLSGNDGARPKAVAPTPAAAAQTPVAPAKPAAANGQADQVTKVQLPDGTWISGSRSKIDAYLRTKGMFLK